MEKLTKLQRQSLILLAVTFAFVTLLNIPVLNTIWRHSFDDGTYSHAFLIPIITGYLYYQLALQGKLQARKTVKYRQIILFFIICFFFYLAVKIQISLAYWLSSLAVYVSATMLIFRFNWPLFFAGLYLVFLYPVWGALTTTLQLLSVEISTLLLNVMHIPIFVEGVFVSIPAGRFEIANGCSGLRYLLVSLAISYLYIFLYIKDFKRALLFISVAITGALVTNWIRITSLIMIGEYTNMTSSLMTDHNNYGWYLYLPFLIILFMMGNKLAPPQLDSTVHKKHQQTALVKDHGLQKKILGVVIVGLILSSTTVMRFNKDKAQIGNGSINTPTISYYQKVEQSQNVEAKGVVKNLTFSFNCRELDCKPDYYANNMIPKGWQVSSTSILDSHTLVRIAKGNQTAIVRYSYSLGEHDFATSWQFKRAKIQHFYRYQKTRLQWNMFICKDIDCVNE